MSQILPLLVHDGNRRLISDWIDQRTVHDVVLVDSVSECQLAKPFDLCIIDGPTLNELREVLEAYRDDVSPEFIPILLFIDRTYADRLSEDVWDHVDDIIWTSGGKQFDSLDTFELRGRMRSLLRARRMSRTLLDNQERLKVLHRVLRHNIRNSLNVIQGRARLIDDSEANEQVRQITQATQRLLRHANNARKVDQILEDPTNIEVDLAAQVERIVESFSEEFPEVTFHIHIQSRVEVTAIDGISLVIEELIQNAITHNPTETPEVSLTVMSATERGLLQVRDTGPPIPEPDQAVLNHGLEPTSLDHGSGLGLWLVVWAVRRSDGVVRYIRESNGNEITIELPTL